MPILDNGEDSLTSLVNLNQKHFPGWKLCFLSANVLTYPIRWGYLKTKFVFENEICFFNWVSK